MESFTKMPIGRAMRLPWVGAVLVASLVAAGFGLCPDRPAHAQQSGSSSVPVPPKTIFDYKTELNLTDKQAADIRQVLVDLNRNLKVADAKLTLLGADIDDLVRKDGTLEPVKKLLTEQAHLMADMRFADLQATQQINKKILSASQLAKWRDIQANSETVKTDEPSKK